MYDNRLSNRFFLCALVLLLSLFWLMPVNAEAQTFSFTTNELDVDSGSSYGGQAVKAATIVGVVGGAGWATQAAVRLALADGTFVTVTKTLAISASRAYNLIGLCTINPVACGAIGVGLGVTALVVYIVYNQDKLMGDKKELDKIIAGVSAPGLPYNMPILVLSPFNSNRQCEDAYVMGSLTILTSDSPFPCIQPIGQMILDGLPGLHLTAYGNIIFSSKFIDIPSDIIATASFRGTTYPASSTVWYPIATALPKPEYLTDLYPAHAPSIISSINPEDRVIDPVENIIPMIYDPVVIDGTEPVDNRPYPPPAAPARFTTAPDGGIAITRPDTPPVTVPPSVPVIPDDDTIPYIPSLPNTQPQSIDFTQAKPVIRDAIKEAIADAQAEANENAIEDAENATPPDTNSFNIMNYLDYGDSWLPAECPNDLVFDIGGQNFVFSYSTVCEYAPSVRTFVLVSSLISFVGIVVGGLKL